MSILNDRKKTAVDLADAVRIIDKIYQNKNNTAVLDALLLVVLNTLADAQEHNDKEVKEWTIYEKVKEVREKVEAEMNADEDSE
jgi:antitoxin component HigA of HigAB toxin-antitoxin module